MGHLLKDGRACALFDGHKDNCRSVEAQRKKDANLAAWSRRPEVLAANRVRGAGYYSRPEVQVKYRSKYEARKASGCIALYAVWWEEIGLIKAGFISTWLQQAVWSANARARKAFGAVHNGVLIWSQESNASLATESHIHAWLTREPRYQEAVTGHSRVSEWFWTKCQRDEICADLERIYEMFPALEAA